ncbi:hypothetical protein BH11MYX3_BH11MYX3_23990 [soil metagenome]
MATASLRSPTLTFSRDGRFLRVDTMTKDACAGKGKLLEPGQSAECHANPD